MPDLSGPMVGGMVRGQNVHWDCATDEEKGLTWGRFYRVADAAGLACARCDALLTEPPKRDAA